MSAVRAGSEATGQSPARDGGAAFFYTELDSPLGPLLALVDERGALRRLHMQAGRSSLAVAPGWRHAPDALAEVRRQLAEYFAGERRRFELALDLRGSAFEQRVWRELLAIPYGETISYGELATRVGKPSAARAVGLANARNPVGVIVPCHRVVGADGSLTGYGGGLPNKRLLLDLESGQLTTLLA